MTPAFLGLLRLAITAGVFVGVLALLRSPYLWALAVREIASRPSVAGEVVFLGSSSITFWSTLARDMAPLAVSNRGFGGSMIAHATHYLPRLLAPPAPSAVVISAGSNDLAWGKSVARVLADLEVLAQRLHALHPGVPLYFVSINRAPSRRLHWGRFDAVNRGAQALAARDPLVRYLDASAALYDARHRPLPGTFGMDRLHMTDEGYARWASVIKPRLIADLERERVSSAHGGRRTS